MASKTLLAFLFILALCSVAQAQHSVSFMGAYPETGDANDLRDPVISTLIGIDLGVYDSPKLGHWDIFLAVDSLPLISTGIQWVYEPEPGSYGAFVAFGIGGVLSTSYFDLGSDTWLFRLSMGAMLEWFIIGWTHWSHASLAGHHNPALDTFFGGIRITF